MKKIISMFIVGLIILTGCSMSDKECSVHFETNGGDKISDIIVSEGNVLTLPSEPIKSGYEFMGWYVDEECLVMFDKTSTISESMVLYAKWNIQTSVYFVYEELMLGYFYINLGEEKDLPENLNIPEYDFGGWYKSADYEEKIETVVGGELNQIFYAKLIEKEIDLDVESEIDLSSLPYHEYLSESNPRITITVKDIGKMTIELFPSVSENTVNNILTYVQNGDYTNSTFHRIIKGFMIQGGIVDDANQPIHGDFSSNEVENELSHYRGVMSMARTNDMDSATSQFFICHQKSVSLDGEYAAFGGLVSGFNVLDYIASVTTTADVNKPIRDVVIESITVSLNGYTVEEVVYVE